MSETLRQRLLRHEGIRLRAYKDSLGKITIGVGRCLETRGISEEEAFYLLDNDIEYVREAVTKVLPWVAKLDIPRQEVLFEMAFQLGLGGLLSFKNTLEAIHTRDWNAAYNGMLNSKWHSQTPERCEELAEIILNG